jgi:hypothetical protein
METPGEARNWFLKVGPRGAHAEASMEECQRRGGPTIVDFGTFHTIPANCLDVFMIEGRNSQEQIS